MDLGRRFHLARHRSELGRGDGVDLRIRDRAVSRQHARIRRTRKGFLLEDSGAPNGVLVNGQRLRGPTLLTDGAVIQLGYSLFRFTGVPKPAVPVGPPPPESPVARAPSKRPVRSELALICFGAALAVVGAVVTFGFATG
jgi:predicted component of type VI protein secretion system